MKTKIVLFAILTTTMVAFLSCSKDNDSSSIKLDTPTLSIVAGNKSQILISPNLEGCTFISDNSLIASVSSAGVVNGNIVGETNIKITNSSNKFNANCKVSVTPQYQMYKEPCLDFTASFSAIKSFEKRTLLSETSTSLIYKGENTKVSYVMYAITNGKVGALVLVPYSSGNVTLLANFITERYLTTVDGDNIYFYNVSKTIAGEISACNYNGSYYYMVMYIAFPDSQKSVSSNAFINIKSTVKELNKFIQ